MSSGFLGLRSAARLTRRRQVAVIAGCALVAIAVTLLSPLVDVAMTRDGRELQLLSPAAAFDGATTDGFGFMRFSLPRAVGAMLVGAALAAAGCAFQAILRNPLAEPFTLGISSGSTLAAVLAMHLGVQGALGVSGVGLAAVLGAVISVALVAGLGRVGNTLPPATLLLAGVTVAMWCAAASMLVQYVADNSQLSSMVKWMMGSLDVVLWPTVVRSAIGVGIGLAVLLAHARDLNALAAGSETAASVGVSVGRTQAVSFVAASLLVGASIAVAGPIGFVGLMVPHVMRSLVGPDHRVLLPASIFGGGTLLVLCDTVARLVLAPNTRLPVGIVTAMIGAPFLVYLLVRAKRSAGLWGRQ